MTTMDGLCHKHMGEQRAIQFYAHQYYDPNANVLR